MFLFFPGLGGGQKTKTKKFFLSGLRAWAGGPFRSAGRHHKGGQYVAFVLAGGRVGARFGRVCVVSAGVRAGSVRRGAGGVVWVRRGGGGLRAAVGGAPAIRVSWVHGAAVRVWVGGVRAGRVGAGVVLWGAGIMAAPGGAAPGVVALVGFSGSRSLSAACAPAVAALIGAVLASGRGVAVGCAPGLDQYVRQVCPSAQVFQVAAFGSGRSALARRSAALVQAVAASGPGAELVVFPGRVCPSGLVPSASSARCFAGFGSGSWSSAALAVGLGLPVSVFGLPAGQLPASWGAWVPAFPVSAPAAASGAWVSGFRLVRPASTQAALF